MQLLEGSTGTENKGRWGDTPPPTPPGGGGGGGGGGLLAQSAVMWTGQVWEGCLCLALGLRGQRATACIEFSWAIKSNPGFWAHAGGMLGCRLLHLLTEGAAVLQQTESTHLGFKLTCTLTAQLA